MRRNFNRYMVLEKTHIDDLNVEFVPLIFSENFLNEYYKKGEVINYDENAAIVYDRKIVGECLFLSICCGNPDEIPHILDLNTSKTVVNSRKKGQIELCLTNVIFFNNNGFVETLFEKRHNSIPIQKLTKCSLNINGKYILHPIKEAKTLLEFVAANEIYSIAATYPKRDANNRKLEKLENETMTITECLKAQKRGCLSPFAKQDIIEKHITKDDIKFEVQFRNSIGNIEKLDPERTVKKIPINEVSDEKIGGFHIDTIVSWYDKVAKYEL